MTVYISLPLRFVGRSWYRPAADQRLPASMVTASLLSVREAHRHMGPLDALDWLIVPFDTFFIIVPICITLSLWSRKLPLYSCFPDPGIHPLWEQVIGRFSTCSTGSCAVRVIRGCLSI